MTSNFQRNEEICERRFLSGGPYYIVTTENLDWILFTGEEDFASGINMIAVALVGLRIRVLILVEMNNHLHLVTEGVYEDHLVFSDRLRLAMQRYQHAKGNPSLLGWEIMIKEIPDLRYLRNAILYVARNPYVANRGSSPVGYRWGSAHLMFNENVLSYNRGIPYSALTFREKRVICRSRVSTLPGNYMVLNGAITMESFVDYTEAELFFTSANQYFRMLSRRVESDAETARWVGESILLPNEDVLRIVAGWFGVKMVRDLGPEERLEAARRMKAELMSNNKQVAQILRLQPETVDALFPVAR